MSRSVGFRSMVTVEEAVVGRLVSISGCKYGCLVTASSGRKEGVSKTMLVIGICCF